MSLADNHEGVVGDPYDIHGHVSDRVERVRHEVFWGKNEPYCEKPSRIFLEHLNGVIDSDGLGTLVSVRVVYDRGVSWASLFPPVK